MYIRNFNKKEHFILINHEDKFYSYNYTKNSFVEIDIEEIKNNIAKNKIGIYLNEEIPLLTKKTKKAI